MLLSAAEVAAGVRRAGARITADYGARGGELVLVGLLRGGLFFLADLARAIALPLQIDTMLPQSYGDARASSGAVKLLQDVSLDLRGRHVLVVDDIYDSGRTLGFVYDRLAARGPASIAFACLLAKAAPRAAAVEVKYRAFEIPDAFVVGCGLDLAGLGRNLRGVWALAPGTSDQTAIDELLTQLRGGDEVD